MIKSFRHKGLQRFFENGSKAGIQAQHERRLRLMLARLDDSMKPADMDAPMQSWWTTRIITEENDHGSNA